MRKTMIALSLIVLVGCERRVEEDRPSLIPVQEVDYLLAIVVDTSGSLFKTDGPAYEFMMKTVERFFRHRIGATDRIVISALSAGDQAPIWDGSPRTLRREFRDAQAFRDFILSNSKAGPTRVHDGITETIEYVMDYSGVASGRTKTGLCILSNMADTLPDSEESKEKLLKTLVEYHKLGGQMVFYWVDHKTSAKWRKDLKEAGLTTFPVESEIAREIAVPNFDN